MNIGKFVLVCFLSLPVWAEKVEVTADSMKAQELQKEVSFMGNVRVKQGQSWLHAQKVIVYFNENNETSKYEALGKVKFEFKDKKNFYRGNAQKVIYYPLKSQYILKGKATIDDVINKRQLRGEEVVLDMKTGKALVKGNRSKPVKFIFDMENK